MNKRKLLHFLAFAFFAHTSSMAQNAVNAKHEFSIQQCIEYASKNNAAVKNALLNIKVQEQVNRGVTAAALPSVGGSAGFTDYIDIPTSLIPGQFFGQPAGTFVPVQFGTKYNANAGVQIQQLLFDGQVFVGLQARNTSIAFQQKNLEVTEENIKANIYKIYYQLVVSKTSIALINANIERLQKLEKDAKALYQSGFSEKLDIDRVSVQLSNLQTEKEKTINNIAIGYMGLKTLIGMPAREELVLTDKITEDEIKTNIVNDTAYSYTDRKEFQYLSLAKQLNEYNIKRYKLSYLPTLSLSGLYSKTAQRTEFDFFKKGDWFTTSYVGVNMSIPIFSGFSKDAKVKQSRFELKQTENNLESLKLSIDNDVKQAQLNFASAIHTMDFQKKNMALAENVFEQTKKKYDAGTGSNTEINSAQTDLVTAQTNYINAMYAAVIAKIDYLKAIGKLP
ncbi:MAG: TolC family protein [Sphingobacteriia bacterium]|nr:TolC family protein [Sphingobacteriia bacterium]